MTAILKMQQCQLCNNGFFHYQEATRCDECDKKMAAQEKQQMPQARRFHKPNRVKRSWNRNR